MADEPRPAPDADLRSNHAVRADLRDNHTGFIWGETTADEVLAIPIRSDDELAALAEIAASTPCTGGGRAHAFALYFWSAFEDFVGALK